MNPGEADLRQYEADATDAVSDQNILARITTKARELRAARDDVAAAEEVLKAAQQRARNLEEYELPELMREAGQEKLRTADGVEVELTETLRASIPVANLPMALRWLMEHGQASIIKRDLRLQFGKNEEDKAEAALALILEGGFMPQDKQRELVSEGVDVPMELLGAHVQAGVKLKEPKR
jgi:hypothetical protein